MQLRSRMRLRALRYAITFVVPLGAFFTFTVERHWTWLTPFFAFVVIPVLELIWKGDHHNLSEEEERTALTDPLFDVMLYLFVPIQYALLVLFLLRVQDTALPLSDLAGMVVTMGILCGVYGINVAHELGHRTKRRERDMARALLLTSLYMHFIIEHNRGHHRRVATPDDPASARYGETLYAFWLRSIVFSWRSAWRIEADRQRKAGHSPYGLRNEMIHAILWQSALLASIGVIFGPRALGAFVIAALIGILLLETVNYIEHYGLRRKQGPTGSYGRVQHVHSWNSDHLIGRVMLFELTRHSDHHWKASKKYQGLQSLENTPQLPTGYPGMMLMSLVPPLFFAAMHPRLGRMTSEHPDLDLAR